MTLGDLYDQIFNCLNENLIGGIDVFEADGANIGLLLPRDNDTETRPIFLLTIQEGRLEVAGDE